MTKIRQSFRQRDVTRALRAARDAGMEPAEVCITKDGDIRILVADMKAAASDTRAVFDEISRHFSNAAR